MGLYAFRRRIQWVLSLPFNPKGSRCPHGWQRLSDRNLLVKASQEKASLFPRPLTLPRRQNPFKCLEFNTKKKTGVDDSTCLTNKLNQKTKRGGRFDTTAYLHNWLYLQFLERERREEEDTGNIWDKKKTKQRVGRTEEVNDIRRHIRVEKDGSKCLVSLSGWKGLYCYVLIYWNTTQETTRKQQIYPTWLKKLA